MPRIKPLPKNKWNAEQQALLAPVQNDKGIGDNARNLFTTLVRHPKLFKRWSVFANHVLFKSSLDPVARELAILRIAWLTQAEYEWGQHVLIARESGLSEATIARVKRGADSEGWSSRECALLIAVDQLHSECEIDPTCWSELQNHYDEKQILDLIFTVGNYRMLASFMKSTEIIRDVGVPALDTP